MSIYRFFIWMVFVILGAQKVWGAACCGGGANFPLLITGDFKAQLATSMSFANVIGDVDTSGSSTFRASGNDEQIRRFLVEGSYLIDPLWQVGVTIPFEYRERSVGGAYSSDYGAADISGQVSYEFLPERTFSYWKPRGFIFTRLTFPTSPSIYDSSQTLATDARGLGLFTVSMGLAFTKNIRLWDFQLMGEVHRSFGRDFQGDDGSFTSVSGSFGSSALLGVGYSIGDLRLGGSLSPSYEGERDVAGAVSSTTPRQIVWDTTLSLSYLFGPEWLVLMSYSDQTLWGPVENTILTRSFAMSLQKRWEL